MVDAGNRDIQYIKTCEKVSSKGYDSRKKGLDKKRKR